MSNIPNSHQPRHTGKTTRLLPPWEVLGDPPTPNGPQTPLQTRAFQLRRPPLHVLIARGVGLGLLIILGLGLLGLLAALSIYAYYASTLPSPTELYERTTPFKSTKIYDRNGRLLFEVFDPLGGRRTIVTFGELPVEVVGAVVATEDATFFSNPGFSPIAIAGALYRDIKQKDVVYGGSTITQQLVKNLYLTGERTLPRKIKEAILAAEITRRYQKTEILEIYLNEVYFGNLAYGIGAAAETYFGKHASDLTLSEAALLAGLLQSPTIYDPYTNPQAALARRATVLRLMRERGYITQTEYEATINQPLVLQPQQIIMEAPHMVMYVREQLEAAYGTEMLYKGGLQVYTTLDLDLQHLAEEVVREKMPELRERRASNAALVVIAPDTGDILAMLGSADFYDNAIDGQVNVARMLRQPGSTIKPFTYLAAMERGWTAATMLMDVAQEFPDGANPPYKPTNYDAKEYGPVSVRTALACSRNIPAVSALYQIGLPALLDEASKLGIHSLTRPDYGLSLALGSGEVTLLEMSGAYGALANGGRRVTPRTVLYITDQTGKVLAPQATPEMPQVVDARLAYIITDILADDAARVPSFGQNSPLKLSFPAAAKTGTTNDYRDSWTIGYTPDFLTGVWVGNSDNTPMDKLAGARGAGIIWHDFMERALASRPHPSFARPEGIVEAEVCSISGHRRTALCPAGRKELFLAENAPKEDCPVHRKIRVCQASGQLATEYCPAESIEERIIEDYTADFDDWARQQGKITPPRQTCTLHSQPVRVTINVPTQPATGVVTVWGVTDVGGFVNYRVEYGRGKAPKKWIRLTPEIQSPVYDGALCSWDTTTLENGDYTLRLIVTSRYGARFEALTTVQVANDLATPTPMHSLTPSATPEPSPSSMPTLEPPPTFNPSPTIEPQPTHQVPTETPVPTSTETVTPTPTDAPPSPTTRPLETPYPWAEETPTPTAAPEII